MIDSSNIAYLPINIPKIQNKNQILSNLQELNHNVIGPNVWNSFNLLQGYSSDKYRDTYQWAESAIKYVPDLIDFIENYIPLNGFRMARLYRQIIEVNCHFDAVSPAASLYWRANVTPPDYLKYIEKNEPLGYKILIHGSRDNHFYMAKNEGFNINEEDRHYIRLPKDTDCFVVPYSTVAHGAILDETDRVMLVMHGYVDPIKHKNLLTESYDKYQDYIIWISDL